MTNRDHLPSNADIIPPHSHELATYLNEQIPQLVSFLHSATIPEALENGVTLDQAKLIHDLGAATYHMALAREQVQNVSAIETRSQVAAGHVLRLHAATPHTLPAVEIQTQQSTEFTSPGPVEEFAPTPGSIPEAPEKIIPPASVPSDQNAVSLEQTTVETASTLQSSETQITDTVREIAGKLNLSDRETNLLQIAFTQIKSDNWFKRAVVDMSSIRFTSESARNQAWSKLANKLIDGGIIEAEGHKFNKHYRFIITREPQEPAKSATSPASPIRPTPLKTPETLPTISLSPEATAAIQSEVEPTNEFANELCGIIAKFKKETGQTRPRAKTIYAHLATVKNVPVDRAQQWIKWLSHRGDYHIASPNGTQVVLPGPSPLQKIQEAARIAPVDPNAWTTSDVEIAYSVLARLWSQGATGGSPSLTSKELLRSFQDGYESQQVTKVLQKLAMRKLIALAPIARPYARSGKGSDDQSVELYNQSIRNLLEKDPTAVKSQLQALVKE